MRPQWDRRSSFRLFVWIRKYCQRSREISCPRILCRVRDARSARVNDVDRERAANAIDNCHYCLRHCRTRFHFQRNIASFPVIIRLEVSCDSVLVICRESVYCNWKRHYNVLILLHLLFITQSSIRLSIAYDIDFHKSVLFCFFFFHIYTHFRSYSSGETKVPLVHIVINRLRASRVL